MKLKIKNGELTGFSPDEKIVVIPNWVNKISNYAFSFYKSENPTIIVIPDSVTSIGVHAFYKCENVTVRCHKGSYAAQYCLNNKIEYEIIDDEKNDILTPDGLFDFLIKEYAKIKGYIPEENSPKDAETVEVIRCKDCKWYQVSKALDPVKFCFRLLDDDGNHKGYNCSDDDFCSKAERKDTDNDI